MKKLISMVFVGLLLVIGVEVASGASPTPAAQQVAPTVAVIDSGVNTALFPNIVAEVCILEYSNCPNGQKFMEGAGAANTGITTNSALTHGNEMLSIINKVSPGIKFAVIRIIGVTDKGNPYIYSNNAVKQGLDWIVANRAKYNIVAVNVSQGKIFDNCKVPDGTAADVAALKAQNVAVIAASGNDSNRTSMMSIACLPDVISVGATDNPDPGVSGKAWDPKAVPYIARYSNGNPSTYFYTNARWFVTLPSGTTKFLVGTSNATAAFTGWWVKNFQKDIPTTLDLIRSTATTASNQWLSGKYVFIPS